VKATTSRHSFSSATGRPLQHNSPEKKLFAARDAEYADAALSLDLRDVFGDKTSALAGVTPAGTLSGAGTGDRSAGATLPDGTVLDSPPAMSAVDPKAKNIALLSQAQEGAPRKGSFLDASSHRVPSTIPEPPQLSSSHDWIELPPQPRPTPQMTGVRPKGSALDTSRHHFPPTLAMAEPAQLLYLSQDWVLAPSGIPTGSYCVHARVNVEVHDP
jgi:hypothetical protein